MQQYLDTENYALITHFDNNVDLYNYIQSRIKEKGESYWSHIKDCTGGRWYGGVNYEQAMNNLLFGNKDTTAKFLDELSETKQEVDTPTSVFIDSEGFAYDMGAVVSGEPECCLNSGAPESKKTINIGIDYSYCCGNSADVLRCRGIAIVNLINTLLAKGYIVNIKMVEVYKPRNEFGSSKNLLYSVSDITIPTENLCIGTVGFYCSVEFFRVIMILTQSMLTEQPNHAGLGRGSSNSSDFLKFFGDDLFFIPGGYVDSKAEKLDTQEKADKFVANLFNEYCKKNDIVLE